MNEQELKELNKSQKIFFDSGKTLDITFRRDTLKKISQLIIKYEPEIFSALYQDLGKPGFESFASETGMVLQELNLMIRNLPKWSRSKRVYTPLVHLIARSYYRCEPYGRVLIISPWNYPFQLLFNPLIGAVAAGNCIIAKPSRSATHTSEFLTKMINDHFNPEYIHLIKGGQEINQWLLNEKYDYIFFTGSQEVGKHVMKVAAETLTPVSLELGGKCPVIVAEDTNIKFAARRILWGKMLNAGQSCVAPDYVIAHSSIKEDLIAEMKVYLDKTFGNNPYDSPDYCRIINTTNTERIRSYLNGNIIYGGRFDAEKKYVSPTLLDNITAGDHIMKEEIFGPVLPVLSYNNLEE
ncbi:MAG: aldehyde dehydrogenase, partial [Bacteroides sp. SM23_62_1]